MRTPRRLVVGLVILASATMAMPTPVAAGGFTIGASLYQCWFVSGGPAVVSVTYRWSNSAGLVKQIGSGTTSAVGTFGGACASTRVEPGDSLQVQVGTTAKTFGIPNLTATLDRAADTISGRAPTSGTLALRFQRMDVDATET